MGTHSWLRGTKICLQNLKILLEPYSRRMSPIFRFFLLYFRLVIKNKKFDVSQGVINLSIAKTNNFTPFLRYCQILRNLVTFQNEWSDKINQRHIRFQNKMLHLLNCNYWFFCGLNTDLWKKIWKNLLKKTSQIFDDFFTLNYKISGTLSPIWVNFREPLEILFSFQI